MTYAFVGLHVRHLASGRPLFFGDTVDASELTPEDERLTDLLVSHPDSPAPEATGPSTSTTED